jgi:hypothetical protein
MATEMVLVPKTRYEKLLTDDKDHVDKVRYYETLLNNNGIGQDNSKSAAEGAGPVENKPVKETPTINDDNNEQNGATVTTNDDTVKLGVIGENKSLIHTNKPIEPPLDSIIERFPRKYRFYAKRLLAYIVKNGLKTITWDAAGTLTYNGAVLRDTNIVDIVKHVFKSIGTPPKGIKQFRKGLSEIRVPKIFLKPFLLKPPGIPDQVKKNWKKY